MVWRPKCATSGLLFYFRFSWLHSCWTQVSKVMSIILQALPSEIMKYTAGCLTGEQLDDVVELLIIKYPCLKGQGSLTGLNGWKFSLRYKMCQLSFHAWGVRDVQKLAWKTNSLVVHLVLSKWRNWRDQKSIFAPIICLEKMDKHFNRSERKC